MKKSLVNAALVGGVALGGSSAMAQSNPDEFRPLSGKPSATQLSHTVAPKVSSALALDGGIKGTAEGGVIQSDKYGNGVSGEVVAYGSDIGIALSTKLQPRDKQAILALGLTLVNDGNSRTIVIISGAMRQSLASAALDNPGYSENLEGRQVNISLVHNTPVFKFGATVRSGSASDTVLAQRTAVSTSQFNRDNGDSVDTILHREEQDYRTTAYGQSWNSLSLSAAANLGQLGEVGGEYTYGSEAGKTTQALGVGYGVNIGSGALKLDAQKSLTDTTDRVSGGARYEGPLGRTGLGYYASARRVAGETVGNIGLIVPMGDKPYTAPRFGQAFNQQNMGRQLASHVRDINNSVSDLAGHVQVREEARGAPRTSEEVLNTIDKTPAVRITSPSVILQLANGKVDYRLTWENISDGFTPTGYEYSTSDGVAGATSELSTNLTFSTEGTKTLSVRPVYKGRKGNPAYVQVVVGKPSESADTPEQITQPKVVVTARTMTISGGSVTDADNPTGFNTNIRYEVTNSAGQIVADLTNLTPNTPYSIQMIYDTYDGKTKTLILGKKAPKQNVTTLPDALIPNDIAFSKPSYPVMEGDVISQMPTTSSPGAITWSSSNTALAVVDANGTVTVLPYTGPQDLDEYLGDVTITATQAATSTHAGGSASYILNVSCNSAANEKCGPG